MEANQWFHNNYANQQNNIKKPQTDAQNTETNITINKGETAMDKKEKALTFEKELKWIQNKNIRKFAIMMLSELPDYFFSIPASSTGKYHPAYSLGEGGLVRHTKAAVLIAKNLLDLEQYKNDFDEEHRDIILTALLLHDGVKHGVDGGKYTVATHPMEMSDFILSNEKICKIIMGDSGEEDELLGCICECIECHMGEWNADYKTKKEILPKPTTSMEKFVHMCDYLASRKFLEVNFDKAEG